MCKVHNNAGSDCILKESVQLNFDEDMAVKDLGANQAKRDRYFLYKMQESCIELKVTKKHNKQDQFLAEIFLWSVDDTALSHWKVLRGKLIVWPPQSARSVALAQALHSGFNLVRPYVESCTTLWLFMIDWLLPFTFFYPLPYFRGLRQKSRFDFFWWREVECLLALVTRHCMNALHAQEADSAKLCQDMPKPSYTIIYYSLPLSTHYSII